MSRLFAKFSNIYVILFAYILLWLGLRLSITPHLSLITFIFGAPIIFYFNGVLSYVLITKEKIKSLNSNIVSISLSLVEIMVVGIMVNIIGRFIFNMPQPLQSNLTIIIFVILYCLKLQTIYIYKLNIFSRLHPLKRQSYLNIFIFTTLLISIALCLAGAVQLNNGGSNILIMCGLGVNALVIFITGVKIRHISETTIIAIIITSTINVLLITSLRSWGISGQDLKNEFKVYTLTNQIGYWSIDNLRDAYNACLSITIFPVVVSKLLNIDALYIFKIVYQLLFSVAVVATYSLTKQYIGKFYAFIAAIFLISMPTFSVDTPLQARQLMAFVFLSTIFLIWLSPRERIKQWKLLFLIFVFALVISHYSTTYVFLATLGLYTITRPIVGRFFKHSENYDKEFDLSPFLVAAIFLVAFAWLSQTTNVSNSLYSSIGRSFSAITRTQNLNKTDDTLPENTIQSYVNTTKQNDNITLEKSYAEIRIVNSNLQPSSLVENLGQKTGISIPNLTRNIYYKFGIIVLIFLITTGLITMLAIKKRSDKNIIPLQVIVLSLVLIGLVFLQYVLPGINGSYGITRTFIQAFFIFAIPLSFGMRTIFRSEMGIISRTLAASITLVFFLTYTGFIPQLTGGIRPQLSLNNSGNYYSTFYENKSDKLAFIWTEENIPSSYDLKAPSYSYSTILAYRPNYPFGGVGILPFQVRDSDYILFNRSINRDSVIYILDNQAIVVNKDLYNNRPKVYSNLQSTVIEAVK